MSLLRRRNNTLPASIIVYRDGVSEGEFLKVLMFEFTAIKAAANGLHPGYNPRVTLAVVQKRHGTRFFPTDHHADRCVIQETG